MGKSTAHGLHVYDDGKKKVSSLSKAGFGRYQVHIPNVNVIGSWRT